MRQRRLLLVVALVVGAAILLLRFQAPSPSRALGPEPAVVATSSTASAPATAGAAPPDAGPAVAFATTAPARPAGPGVAAPPAPGWAQTAESFARAFTADLQTGRWYAGLTPHLSPHLAQAYRLTSPDAAPDGDVLGVSARDADAVAVTAVVRLRGGTGLVLGLAYDGTRWWVTDVTSTAPATSRGPA